MYEPGQLIFYGSQGVYRVEEIAPIRQMKCGDPNKLYYKLSAVHREDITYVPVDTSISMRPILSFQDASSLLENAGSITGEAYMENNPKLLQAHYRQIVDTHSAERLISLIQSIKTKERQLRKLKKRESQIDIEFKKRAENLVCDELSAALSTPMEDIRTQLSANIKGTALSLQAVSN
jgi:CarD family transcriptional regulator